MVVKLFFTDGTDCVRSFSDKELMDLKIFDNMSTYLAPEYPLNGWEFIKMDSPITKDIRVFDIREYFNFFQPFSGVLIDNRVVDRVEFFEKGSFEHTLDLLENEGYDRKVQIHYTLDHYYYSKSLEFSNIPPEFIDPSIFLE